MIRQYNFFKLVREELDTIKSNATPEEINNLNFDTFDFADSQSCIYGQLTGGCYNDRAKEINPKIYNYLVNIEYDVNRNNLRYSKQGAEFKIHCFENKNDKQLHGYTGLEKYIFMCDQSKRREIIDYLKDNIPTINID